MGKKGDEPTRKTYPHAPNIKQVATERSENQLPDKLRDGWRSSMPFPDNFTPEHEQRILSAVRDYALLRRAKDRDAYIRTNLSPLIGEIMKLADAASGFERTLAPVVDDKDHFDAICDLLQSASLSIDREAIGQSVNPLAGGGDHETAFWLINSLRDQHQRGVYRVIEALGRETERRHCRQKGNPGKALITSFLAALLDVYSDATGLPAKRPDKGRALEYLLEINDHLPDDVRIKETELTRRARDAAIVCSNRATDK